MQHCAAACACGPCGIHDEIGVALVQNHDDQFMIEFHMRRSSCFQIVGQIGERSAARHALERHGQQNPVAGNVEKQLALGSLDKLRGLLCAGDGGGDGFGCFIQAVDGQMLIFGRASSGCAEDHRQTRLAEQGVHGLAPVGIGNGNDII